MSLSRYLVSRIFVEALADLGVCRLDGNKIKVNLANARPGGGGSSIGGGGGGYSGGGSSIAGEGSIGGGFYIGGNNIGNSDGGDVASGGDGASLNLCIPFKENLANITQS